MKAFRVLSIHDNQRAWRTPRQLMHMLYTTATVDSEYMLTLMLMLLCESHCCCETDSHAAMLLHCNTLSSLMLYYYNRANGHLISPGYMLDRGTITLRHVLRSIGYYQKEIYLILSNILD
jgi:hypothetical protein